MERCAIQAMFALHLAAVRLLKQTRWRSGTILAGMTTYKTDSALCTIIVRKNFSLRVQCQSCLKLQMLNIWWSTLKCILIKNSAWFFYGYLRNASNCGLKVKDSHTQIFCTLIRIENSQIDQTAWIHSGQPLKILFSIHLWVRCPEFILFISTDIHIYGQIDRIHSIRLAVIVTLFQQFSLTALHYSKMESLL